MGEPAPFVEGDLAIENALHRVSLNLLRSNIDDGKAKVICHYITDWCYSQCCGEWRVEHSRFLLTVYFRQSLDAVMFKISPEFDIMQRHSREMI